MKRKYRTLFTLVALTSSIPLTAFSGSGLLHENALTENWQLLPSDFVELSFEGIEQTGKVWLNGELLADRDTFAGPFKTHRLDISAVVSLIVGFLAGPIGLLFVTLGCILSIGIWARPPIPNATIQWRRKHNETPSTSLVS